MHPVESGAMQEVSSRSQLPLGTLNQPGQNDGQPIRRRHRRVNTINVPCDKVTSDWKVDFVQILAREPGHIAISKCVQKCVGRSSVNAKRMYEFVSLEPGHLVHNIEHILRQAKGTPLVVCQFRQDCMLVFGSAKKGIALRGLLDRRDHACQVRRRLCRFDPPCSKSSHRDHPNRFGHGSTGRTQLGGLVIDLVHKRRYLVDFLHPRAATPARSWRREELGMVVEKAHFDAFLRGAGTRAQ